ncbi:hypothetical protein AKO1_008070 [Acrasis kona]|uniref:Uncharacterized protein n=1 Tax=Acrasis kona TaxID=1008807 RepID=A0AAW2YPJ4_9EUKA
MKVLLTLILLFVSYSLAIVNHDALVSLSRFLKYMKKKYNLITIDTVYSLRGLQGILNGTDNVAYQKLSEEFGHLAELAIPIQKQNFPRYYSSMHKLIDKSSTFIIPTYVALPPPNITIPSEDHFDEKLSDSCITQMLNCKLSDSCENLEKKLDTNSYTLTHQILYYQLALKCKSFTKKYTKRARRLIAQMVSNMRLENKLQTKTNDIYAERIYVGIITGYYNYFVTKKIIKRLIRAQTSLGCWEGDPEEANVLYDTDSFDQCSFHTSGIVAYNIAAYLRFQ